MEATVSGIGGTSIILGASLTMLASKGGTADYFSLFAVSLGISIIIASAFLYQRPLGHGRLGLVILIFALASSIGTDGFIAGAIGGLLAIIWVP